MTTEEYISKLEKHQKNIKDAAFFFKCISEAHRKKVERIFLTGRMVVNKYTKKYRYTSKAYIAKRRERGRQVSYVDLRFETDLQKDHATTLYREGDTWISGVKRQDSGKMDRIYNLYGDNLFHHTGKEIKELNICIAKTLAEDRA